MNLASSTATAENSPSATGFVISYVARVKCNMGSMVGELVADVPFKLMHPAPGKKSPIYLPDITENKTYKTNQIITN